MLHFDFDSTFVVIAFHTNKWLQHLVEDLWDTFPTKSILLVNNNPRPGEQLFYNLPKTIQQRQSKTTQQKSTVSKKVTIKDYTKEMFLHDITEENKWIKENANRFIKVLEPQTRDLTHGAGIDLARKWCIDNNISTMTHIEPDCFFRNENWYHEHIDAIKHGYWMVSSFKVGHKSGLDTKLPLGIYACTILIKPTISKSFVFQHRDHYSDPKIIGPGYRFNSAWDTGHAIWYHCAARNKALFIPNKNIWHYGNSAVRDFTTRDHFRS